MADGTDTGRALIYPDSRADPVENNVAGVVFDDPYQWLEDDTEDVRRWEAAQSRLARDHIRAWPGWSRLRAMQAGAPAFEPAVAPIRRGDRWFRQLAQPGAEVDCYQVGPAPDGPWQVVLDLSAMATDGPLDVTVTPSPDGDLLAVTLGPRGASANRLMVVDTSTARRVLEPVALVNVHSVSWLGDSSGFYFVAATGGTEVAPAPTGVYRYTVGAAAPTEPELSALPHPYAEVLVTGNGRDVLVFLDYTRMHPHYIRRGDEDWQTFITDPAHLCKGEIVGDDYIAISTLDAPRGRLVRVPLHTASEPSTWTDLVPAGDAVLTDVRAIGGRLVLATLVDGLARVSVLSIGGDALGEIPLPGVGALSGVTRTATLIGLMDFLVPCGDAVTFVFGSFDQPPTAYVCDLDSLSVRALSTPHARIPDIVVETRRTPSRDGTIIPYTLVYRRGTDLEVPRPALISGYGGFNVLFLPSFLGMYAPIVAAGGVFVHANLRGGGELGTDWWAGGRMETKQNTFDDLYAIAEQLIADGVTAPDRLSLLGGSNAGLLVAAAATQRPDLWRAIVCLVPMLDLLRGAKEVQTRAALVNELGDPADPAAAARLFSYSPYHNVHANTSYPAVLLAPGDSDPVCPAWHSRKMAARLQAATTSGLPILLDVIHQTGHAFENNAAALADHSTDWIAFLMSELGLDWMSMDGA